MFKKLLCLLTLIGISCLPAIAQNGVRYDSYAFATVTGGNGLVVVPNALVTVCTSVGSGNPCTPTANIYSDAALQNQITLSQVTADAGGNFGFYLAPGRYTYSLKSPNGLLTGFYNFTASPTLDSTNSWTQINNYAGVTNVNNGGAELGTFTGNHTVSGNVTETGNNTHSGAETFTNLNGCIVVELPTYAATNAGIQAAVNAAGSGGCVYLPVGTYALTAMTNEQIKITNPINFICGGWGTILQVGSSVGAIPTIHIVVSGVNAGIRIQDCSILPQSGTPGSAGIQVDVATGQDLLKLIVEHVQIGLLDGNFFTGGLTQLGGHGIVLNGPGFLGDVEIEHSYIAGGVLGTGLGDSVSLSHDIIQGTGNGVDVTFLPGASSLRIDGGTINPRTGCAVHLGAGSTFNIISRVEFETPNNTAAGCDGAWIDIDGLKQSISSISVTSNVVTLVTTANLPVNTFVGEQVFVAGVTNAAYNGGPFTIASFNGTNTITYPQTLSTTSSSGGTVGNPTTGLDMEKNQCQIVSSSTINCLRLNYAQNSVIRDNNFILPGSPGFDIVLTANASGNNLYSNNFNGATFAQALSDSSGLGNTFYGFGGQNRPDLPLISRDSGNNVNIYGGGTTSQLFGIGAPGSNTIYDGNANAAALIASNAGATAAASTAVSVYKLFAMGAQPQATFGLAGTTSGQTCLAGSTSGTACFTAPAVAGTTTNPVVSTNTLQTIALALSNTNNMTFTPAAMAAARTVNIPDPLQTTTTLPLVIANGTLALNTASVTTATCDGGKTVSATGTLSTDAVDWSFNSAPTTANKYGAFLVVYAVPTANTVTFYTCNPSATTSTPTAITVNWSVRRP